jgi:hypothetical protein
VINIADYTRSFLNGVKTGISLGKEGLDYVQTFGRYEANQKGIIFSKRRSDGRAQLAKSKLSGIKAACGDNSGEKGIILNSFKEGDYYRAVFIVPFGSKIDHVEGDARLGYLSETPNIKVSLVNVGIVKKPTEIIKMAMKNGMDILDIELNHKGGEILMSQEKLEPISAESLYSNPLGTFDSSRINLELSNKRIPTFNANLTYFPGWGTRVNFLYDIGESLKQSNKIDTEVKALEEIVPNILETKETPDMQLLGSIPKMPSYLWNK